MASRVSNLTKVQAVAAAERAFTSADAELRQYVTGVDAGGTLDLDRVMQLRQARAEAHQEHQRLVENSRR